MAIWKRNKLIDSLLTNINFQLSCSPGSNIIIKNVPSNLSTSMFFVSTNYRRRESESKYVIDQHKSISYIMN